MLWGLPATRRLARRSPSTFGGGSEQLRFETLMRVLVVEVMGEMGGAQASLARFAKCAVNAGVQIRIVMLEDGPLRDDLETNGAEVVVYPGGAPLRRLDRTLRAIFAVAREAVKWNADVVYANGTKSHIYGSPGAALARKPYVWRLCDMLIPGVTPLYRVAASLPSSAIITDSDAVASTALMFSHRLRHLRTVYPGIDLPDASAIGGKLREELKIPVGAPVIAVIGRLQRWKGQDVFVRASVDILARHPDTRLVVIGGALFGLDLDFPGELAALAQELGVAKSLHFLGHRTDVQQLLPDLDVVALTSLTPEPFGTIQIEAMAAGRPLVSTRAGGNGEVVVDGVSQ